MLKAIHAKKSWAKKLLEWVPKLRPTFSAEIDLIIDQPSFGLTVDAYSSGEVKEMIQELLTGLGNLGERVVIAVDEFQKIAQLEDQHWLEATIRTHMQQLKNCAFLFTGSRRSIIYEMLNDRSRPFYRSCQSIEFPLFGTEFTDWILEKFKGIGISCSRCAIDHLRSLVQETPNYVQMICFYLTTQNLKTIAVPDVEAALKAVVGQNQYAYQSLFDSLTPNQQKTLRLVAKEKSLFATKELLSKYELPSKSVLTAAIKSLKNKAILDAEGSVRGNIVFDDPLFSFWLAHS
jgi:hypothetical protein